MTRPRGWLVAALAGVAALLAVPVQAVPAPALPAAQAAPAPAAASCSGVWVVVAGQGTACATGHATGKAALRSAGFTVTERSPGFLCRINGYPDDCNPTTERYWSYWQAEKRADGSWGPWVYSQRGYASTKPKQGNAEGWAFGNGSSPPGSPPVDSPPAAAPTTSVAAPRTTAPATAPRTSAPAARRPQRAATSGTTARAGAGSPPPDTPTPVAPPTDPTPASADPPPASADPTPAATATPARGGVPWGVVATVGILLLGGGGLGAHHLRHRHPH